MPRPCQEEDQPTHSVIGSAITVDLTVNLQHSSGNNRAFLVAGGSTSAGGVPILPPKPLDTKIDRATKTEAAWCETCTRQFSSESSDLRTGLKGPVMTMARAASSASSGEDLVNTIREEIKRLALETRASSPQASASKVSPPVWPMEMASPPKPQAPPAALTMEERVRLRLSTDPQFKRVSALKMWGFHKRMRGKCGKCLATGHKYLDCPLWSRPRK